MIFLHPTRTTVGKAGAARWARRAPWDGDGDASQRRRWRSRGQRGGEQRRPNRRPWDRGLSTHRLRTLRLHIALCTSGTSGRRVYNGSHRAKMALLGAASGGVHGIPRLTRDGETAKRSAVHPDVRHPPTKGEPSGRSSVVQGQHDHGQQRGIESKPRSRRRWSAEINGGGAQR